MKFCARRYLCEIGKKVGPRQQAWNMLPSLTLALFAQKKMVCNTTGVVHGALTSSKKILTCEIPKGRPSSSRRLDTLRERSGAAR